MSLSISLVLVAHLVQESGASESPELKQLLDTVAVCQADADLRNITAAKLSCRKVANARDSATRYSEQQRIRRLAATAERVLQQLELEEREFLSRLKAARGLFRQDRLLDAREALKEIKAYAADPRYRSLDNDVARREAAIEAAMKPPGQGPASGLYLALDYFRTCKGNIEDQDWAQAKKDCERAKGIVSKSKFRASEAPEAGNLKAEIVIKLLDIDSALRQGGKRQ